MAVSLLKTGKPVPVIEILTAAICPRRDLLLLATDVHFTDIKSIKSDFGVRFWRHRLDTYLRL